MYLFVKIYYHPVLLVLFLIGGTFLPKVAYSYYDICEEGDTFTSSPPRRSVSAINGPRLETLIRKEAPNLYNDADWQFRFPLGFKGGWDSQFGDFTSFWMPEKRYSEVLLSFFDRWYSRVCEDGRPRPRANEYFISFSYLAVTDFRITVSTELKLKPAGKDLWESTLYGLLHDLEYTHSYRTPVGHPYHLLIECRTLIPGSCMGRSYFEEEKLVIWMQFDVQYIALWQTNLIAVLEFLKSWEAMTPETISDTQIEQIINKIKEASYESE